MKRVQETKSAKSISAYVILRKNKFIGKIQVHHGEGRTFCNIWIDDYACKTNLMLYGSASGYGYNKENACIADAIASITCKYTWSKAKNAYTHKPAKFDVSALESSGPRALEDMFNCTVIQAI